MTWAQDTLIAVAVERLVNAVVEELADVLLSGASVLDVGCGGGQVLEDTWALGDSLRRQGVTVSRLERTPMLVNCRRVR